MSNWAWVLVGLAAVIGSVLFAALAAGSSLTGDYRLLGGLLLLGGVITIGWSVARGKR